MWILILSRLVCRIWCKFALSTCQNSSCLKGYLVKFRVGFSSILLPEKMYSEKGIGFQVNLHGEADSVFFATKSLSKKILSYQLIMYIFVFFLPISLSFIQIPWCSQIDISIPGMSPLIHLSHSLYISIKNMHNMSRKFNSITVYC